MLRYATCVYFTVNIIFINFDKHSLDAAYKLYRHTCLAPEEIKKLISGPRPEKVVHHWYNGKFIHCTWQNKATVRYGEKTRYTGQIKYINQYYF